MLSNVWRKGLVLGIVIFIATSIIPIEKAQLIDPSTFKEKKISENANFNNILSYRWNAREITVRYNMTIENEGNYTVNITTFLAQPCSLDNQEIQGPIRYEPAPDGFATDRWGQTVAYYEYILPPAQNITLSWEANATVYTVRYIIIPWRIRGVIPDDIKENYTADDSLYKINDPYIQEIVNNVVGDTKNLLLKALKLHDYVINHLDYVHDDKWDDALTVLKRGNGSCTEYCFAYIALCRAAGIPARYNGGSLYKKEPPHIDTMYHRIVEIYLPSYGWVPVDVTRDDYTWLRHFCFGLHINELFTLAVGGGSSEYLNWSYHYWQEVTPPSNEILVNKSITWLRWDRVRLLNFLSRL